MITLIIVGTSFLLSIAWFAREIARAPEGWQDAAGWHAGAEPIRVLCAWCGAVIHAGPPAPISHGICVNCLAKELAALASLSKPVTTDTKTQ
jgi:hypothetical protein